MLSDDTACILFIAKGNTGGASAIASAMVRNKRPVHHHRQRVWPRGMSLGVKAVAKHHAVGRRHNAKQQYVQFAPAAAVFAISSRRRTPSLLQAQNTPNSFSNSVLYEIQQI
jgi:hypothetical protein